jgi:hypothetical protein
MKYDEEYKPYLFEYWFRGECWAFEIVAKNHDEAKQRLYCMSGAEYKGQVKAKIAVAPNFVLKLYERAKRFFGGANTKRRSGNDR